MIRPNRNFNYFNLIKARQINRNKYIIHGSRTCTTTISTAPCINISPRLFSKTLRMELSLFKKMEIKHTSEDNSEIRTTTNYRGSCTSHSFYKKRNFLGLKKLHFRKNIFKNNKKKNKNPFRIIS